MASGATIRRAVTLLSVFLVAYAVLIEATWAWIPQRPESQWSGNLMRAQQYIYDHRDAPVVVVGSSLFNQVPQEALPPDMFKLAMSGMSAYDGLDIMIDADAAPRLVMIETNVLDKMSTGRLRESVSSRGWHALKAHLRFLREEARPLSMVGTVLATVADGFRSVLRHHLFSRPSAANAPVGAAAEGAPPDSVPDGHGTPLGAARRKEVAEQQLPVRLARWDVEPDAATVRAIAETLGGEVAALEARGTRVVFFEMPTDPRLCGNRFVREMRTLIASEWPASTVLPPPDCGAFRTADGLHLINPDAVRYAHMLIDQVRARDMWPGG